MLHSNAPLSKYANDIAIGLLEDNDNLIGPSTTGDMFGCFGNISFADCRLEVTQDNNVSLELETNTTSMCTQFGFAKRISLILTNCAVTK